MRKPLRRPGIEPGSLVRKNEQVCYHYTTGARYNHVKYMCSENIIHIHRRRYYIRIYQNQRDLSHTRQMQTRRTPCDWFRMNITHKEIN